MAIEWKQESDGSYANLSAELMIFADLGEPFAWSVERMQITPMASIASGTARSHESAKLAAVEAWRRWAREQAEACGFTVTEGE